jgi:hypothetical protein
MVEAFVLLRSSRSKNKILQQLIPAFLHANFMLIVEVNQEPATYVGVYMFIIH